MKNESKDLEFIWSVEFKFVRFSLESQFEVQRVKVKYAKLCWINQHKPVQKIGVTKSKLLKRINAQASSITPKGLKEHRRQLKEIMAKMFPPQHQAKSTTLSRRSLYHYGKL